MPTRQRESLRLLGISALFTAVFGLPVLMVVLGAFRNAAPGAAGSWTLVSFRAVLTDVTTREALLNNALLALGSVGLGVFTAVVLCWLSQNSNTFLRWAVTPTMVVVFAVPQLFYALSWSMLGQQPAGTLNKLFEAISGSDAAPVDLSGWPGMILVMGLRVAAISYLVLLGPFRSMDASFAEAAVVSGSSRLGAILRVELPVLAPAISSTVLLGGVIAFGSLDIPLLFGGPAEIPVLSTEIYEMINARFPANYAAANTLGLCVVAVVAVLVLLQRSVLRGRRFTTVSGKAHRREVTDLGRLRWLGGAVIAIFVLVALVLPVGQLVLGSLQPYAGVFDNLSLDHYRDVLAAPNIVDAFTTTLWTGLLAGLIATCIAVVVNLLAQRSRNKLGQVPQVAVFALLSVPGITIALGLLAAVLIVPGLSEIYGTRWLNVAGLAITMTPIASRTTQGAIAQINIELEEAAKVSGASTLRATTEILGRLILPTFVASWFITAIVSAGNLEVPALLSSPSSETISVVALNLFTAGSLARASAVFCLMLLFVSGFLLLAALIRFGVSAIRRQRPRSAALVAPPVTTGTDASSGNGGTRITDLATDETDTATTDPQETFHG